MQDIDTKVHPKYYTMDPLKEDILFDAVGLLNGMVVMLENPDDRQHFSSTKYNEAEYAAAEIKNAWCVVSELKISDTWVEFIGIYAHGVKRKRRHRVGMPWLVKIGSLEHVEPSKFQPNAVNYADMKNEFHRLVLRIMDTQDSYTYAGESSKARAQADDFASKLIAVVVDQLSK